MGSEMCIRDRVCTWSGGSSTKLFAGYQSCSCCSVPVAHSKTERDLRVELEPLCLELGWWVTPSSTSFSGMMRDCDAYGGFARSVLEQTWEHVPQSRESVWATIRHWTFFPLADVRKTSLLRQQSSTSPFAPSQNLHGSLHLLCPSLHLSSLTQC